MILLLSEEEEEEEEEEYDKEGRGLVDARFKPCSNLARKSPKVGDENYYDVVQYHREGGEGEGGRGRKRGGGGSSRALKQKEDTYVRADGGGIM